MTLSSASSPTAERALSGQLAVLAVLAEMAGEFANSLDLERALERGIARIAEHLGAEGGSLWLLENDAAELVCHGCVGPTRIAGRRLPVSEGIIGRSVRENACQSVLDARADPHFAAQLDARSGFRTRSLLCAPMRVQDRTIGAIELVNKKGGNGQFAPGDIQVLQALAASAALAIENARLAASLIEHERVQRELQVAAEIQRSLLPAPRPPPFPVYGVNVPARTVSGDLFDILPLEGGAIAFCLGDVSGKGMNAALLMAKTASLYRCLAKSIDAPGRLLGVLNDEICETATRGMFVTMVAGVLEPRTGRARIANAGHEPPLLRSAAGAFESFPAEMPPLGITPGVSGGPSGAGSFPEVEASLDGGCLYVFSDGLTEACSGGSPLGAEGVMHFIERHGDLPLAERVTAIVTGVGRLELRDDLTLLAVSAEPPRD